MGTSCCTAKPVAEGEGVGLAESKNYALLFIKPHAVTEEVKNLVQSALQEAGIKVASEGQITAEAIDRNRLIDTHYGAIAAKAVKMKPESLIVTPESKKLFMQKFGCTWADALGRKVVYSAKEAAAKLGEEVLGAKWNALQKGETLLKFGGGFYVGKVDNIYVVNGFYLAMRKRFTKPGGCIHYYTVEWDVDTLSWADFRGKVLGATDPAEAAEGSIRSMIFKNWKSYGLTEEPDTGNNGMHGSASPFEGLCERLNWLKAPLPSDPFGSALQAYGLPEASIVAMMSDPQVSCDGKVGGVFDQLEDLDGKECLQKASKMTLVDLKTAEARHFAFVFIKPHAVTQEMKELVRKRTAEAGIVLTREGQIMANLIDQKLLIDTHYGAIATKAVKVKPESLSVKAESKQLFQSKFGLSWEDALSKGLVLNAKDAAAKLGEDQVSQQWDALTKGETLLKFGGGFYIGKFQDIYVVNGFYVGMRKRFTKPGSSIYWFTAEWEASGLSWADFRGKVLGGTDPKDAAPGSIRNEVFTNWRKYGLAEEPDTGNNGVHASASPFEAFCERCNWLDTPLANDPFGKGMVAKGMSAAAIEGFMVDPQVYFGTEAAKWQFWSLAGGVFDQLEDLNGKACLDKVCNMVPVDLRVAETKNFAFLFIKPHAVNEAIKKLVREKADQAGIKLMLEGEIKANVIDQQMLIDTHYGAIAAKAVVLSPESLHVQPAAKELFKTKFGLSWDDALKQKLVLNGKDASAKFGADKLGPKWDTLTKGETLLKFGGGFYVGKIDNIYVVNGFYMDMRKRFTAKDASIYFYTIEWDAAVLSWGDFRGKVLGATDPREAAKGSIRSEIFTNWKSYGLAQEPDTGNNGVHASASPFEGFCERTNWLGTMPDEDAFGKALVFKGVAPDTITAFMSDPQVYLEGEVASVFDKLEDLDGRECLERASKMVLAD